MKISVVIPVYRSEKIIDDLYYQLCENLDKHYKDYELIFVEDASPDKVWKKIETISNQDEKVIGLQLMRNSGQGAATLCGIQIAKGDIIVTMDDDLQHPPGEIHKLVELLINDDDIDVVIGKPIEKKHNLIRRFGSNFINSVNSKFLKKDPDLRFTGFRAMTADVAKELITIQTPYPALGPLLLQVTRRIKNSPFSHLNRKVGKSNYSISKIIRQTLSNFIGYSMLPLRLLAILGAIGIFISFVLGCFYLFKYLIVGVKTTGWTTLVLILTALSGFNFFAFAVLGEYVLRIMQISSSTPLYTIRKSTKKN